MSDIARALAAGAAALIAAGIEDARAEARLLLAYVSGLTPAQLFNRSERPLDGEAERAFNALISRRSAGEPLSYLTGIREFWSLPFCVTPETLIPRPDTETVVELALDVFSTRPPPAAILDMGTGSGCLLLALLTEYPDAVGTGLDASPGAIAVAQSNAVALGLDGRCRMINGSWSAGLEETFDLIVSNPPYIPGGDIATLARDVRAYEPTSALDGGPDGLDAYRALLPVAMGGLNADGVIVLEIGIGQADAVCEIAAEVGLQVTNRRRDLAGIERALSLHKKSVGITGGNR